MNYESQRLYESMNLSNMKRVIFIILCLQLYFTPSIFGASITSSPESLVRWNFAVSLEDDLIFKRDLETTGSLEEAELENANRLYANLMLGLSDYYNLYTKLGIITGSEYHFAAPTVIDYETDPGFFGGLGMTGTYEFAGGYKLAGDVQVNAWVVDANSVKRAGSSATSLSGTQINNYELKTSALLLKDFNLPTHNVIVTPYTGIGISYFKTETDGTISYIINPFMYSNSWSLGSDDIFSIITGLSAEVADNWKVSLEGRFLAETALSGSVTYLFGEGRPKAKSEPYDYRRTYKDLPSTAKPRYKRPAPRITQVGAGDITPRARRVPVVQRSSKQGLTVQERLSRLEAFYKKGRVSRAKYLEEKNLILMSAD